MSSARAAPKHIKPRWLGLLLVAASVLMLAAWLLAVPKVIQTRVVNNSLVHHRKWFTGRAPHGHITVADVLSRSPQLVIHNSSYYFTYVAEALHHTLVELGIECTVAQDLPPSANVTAITFTTHELGASLPKHYISYNFEQLITDKQWHPDMWKRFKAAQMVWDYSLENIKVLHAHNISHTVHVPLGYASTMDSPATPAALARDVDVLFYGVLRSDICQHRYPLLEAVGHAVRQKNGSGVQCASEWAPATAINETDMARLALQQLQLPTAVLTSSCWGEALQQMYRRSKVALNLHCYVGKTILEVHRLLPLVVNRVIVLSEHSDDPWWDAQYSDIVNFTQGTELIEDMRAVLQQSAHTFTSEAEHRYQRLLACCSYNRYVGAALRQRVQV
eukprot:GHRQ01004551.1.p1 GENE.GHRQ01004551.1~~GHRQ01004551.1.p1  ORF type:complete len:390 (+),score=47.29 GHRQ01004551.1:150-1319(+)